MRFVTQLTCMVFLAAGLLQFGSRTCGNTAGAQEESQQPAATSSEDPSWANEFLDQDPLELKTPTEDDLLLALGDPERRDYVIPQHFPRATDLSREQQEVFLRLALKSESKIVQRQAAAELKRLGLLEKVVREILLDLLHGEDQELRHAAVVALETVALEAYSDAYLDGVIEALQDEDARARESAERQLLDLGVKAVPALLEKIQDGEPEVRINAAVLLGQIVGSKRAVQDSAVPRETADEPAPAKFHDLTARDFPIRRPRGSRLREIDEAKLASVRVYFGTNRALATESVPPWRRFVVLPAVLVLLTAFVRFSRWRRRSADGQNEDRRSWRSLKFLLVAAALLGWGVLELNRGIQELGVYHHGPEFSLVRDPSGEIHYGYCDVTVPPTHRLGEVEQPLLGPEDEKQHVVLKETTLLSDDTAFYLAVKQELSRRELDARDCFVFVHGFNVNFSEAARRTAQIHHDLEFRGVPLFYSWPSRGSLKHYLSDRNEIGYSKDHIKRFLQGVANELDARRVHVIAHSMGGNAVSHAIAEIEGGEQLFDQIVLAAPDIDADVFREQLVPRLARKGQRTTLYCSRCDLALHVSYAFNGYPRAGDSSRSILVADDMDTVDASEIATDLLGHSYYGDGMRVLEDIQELLRANADPQDRNLLPQGPPDGLAYWIFGDFEAQTQRQEISGFETEATLE